MDASCITYWCCNGNVIRIMRHYSMWPLPNALLKCFPGLLFCIIHTRQTQHQLLWQYQLLHFYYHPQGVGQINIHRRYVSSFLQWFDGCWDSAHPWFKTVSHFCSKSSTFTGKFVCFNVELLINSQIFFMYILYNGQCWELPGNTDEVRGLHWRWKKDTYCKSPPGFT